MTKKEVGRGERGGASKCTMRARSGNRHISMPVAGAPITGKGKCRQVAPNTVGMGAVTVGTTINGNPAQGKSPNYGAQNETLEDEKNHVEKDDGPPLQNRDASTQSFQWK